MGVRVRTPVGSSIVPDPQPQVTRPTVPYRPPQPEPISIHAIQGEDLKGPRTTISRLFILGEEKDCRLCPREMCRVDKYGHCVVEVPCHVPDELAATFPLLGDARLVEELLAARRDRVAYHG